MSDGSPRLAWAAAASAAALLLAGLILLLAQPATRAADVNDVPAAAFSVILAPGAELCQPDERVPADAAAIAVTAGTFGARSPRLFAEVRYAGIRRRGSTRAYRDGGVALVPLSGSRRAVFPAMVCLRNDGRVRLALAGKSRPAALVVKRGTARARGAVHLEWTLPARPTWLGLLPTIAARAGGARGGLRGSALLWIAIALIGLAAAMAIVVTVRSATRALAPRPIATLVVAVGFVSALVWGALTPPFQVPDEYKHVAYAERIRDTGRPPRLTAGEARSPELVAALNGTEFEVVVFNPRQKPPWSTAESVALRRALARPLSSAPDAAAHYAASYGPVYYAAAALAARVTPGDVLDRLAAMRVVSALLAALTVLFTVLFLRETVPGAPWAWAVGGLAAGLQPLFSFIEGGVNNDAGLFCAAAALFWLLARAFRRGLTVRVAVALGLVLALGLLTKPTLLAFVPGVAVGILLVLGRDGPLRSRAAARRLAGFALALAVPLIAYVLVNSLVWDRATELSTNTKTLPGAAGAASLRGALSYVWQFYLPRLPGMQDWFPAGLPVRHAFFETLVGRFGWLDASFPTAVYSAAFVAALLLVALAARTLFVRRAEVRARWREVVTYALLVLGTLGLIHGVGYRMRLAGEGGFEQARYLFVLLPLYALGIALAVRGAGRRWVPVAAPVVVVLLLAQAAFGLTITLGRYYG